MLRCPKCSYFKGGAGSLGGCFCDEEAIQDDGLWQPPGDPESFWMFCCQTLREGWLGLKDWAALYQSETLWPSFGHWIGHACDTEEQAKNIARGMHLLADSKHVGVHRMADLVEWYQREKEKRE